MNNLKAEVCPTCGGNLWQEHSNMFNTKPHIVGVKHKMFKEPELIFEPEKTMIDNWHCSRCKSVFTDKELKQPKGSDYSKEFLNQPIGEAMANYEMDKIENEGRNYEK